MKKLGAALLSLVMLMTLLAPAAAANSAKATTMRLAAIEGTVTMRNQNERSLTVKEEMKLYSGYTVKTGSASYAYISLDDAKAIKMDASTTAEVRKSGKKLEVLVTAGKIFFNVTVPLADDETMEIRTSTMVTGVRGTSGIINCVDERTSSLHVLDGAVTMQAADPVSGKSVVVPVQAGQVAVVTKQETSAGTAPTEAPQVVVSTLEAKDVPGFAAAEIAKDTALQEKIAQQSALDVKQVVEGATNTLAREQKAAEEAEKRVEQSIKKTENQKAVVPAIPAPEPPKSSDPPNSDSSGSDTPLEPPAPPEPPVPPEPPEPPEPPAPPEPPVPPAEGTILTGTVTAQQLADALASDDDVILQPDSPVDITGLGFELPAETTLTLRAPNTHANAAVLAVTSGTALTVAGTLCIEADGLLLNNGTLTLMSSGRITGDSQAALGTVEFDNSPIVPLAVQVTQDDKTEICRVAGMAALLRQFGGVDTVTVKILAPGDLNQAWGVKEQQVMTLDLNGQTLTVNAAINNRGQLTVSDSSGNGTLDLQSNRIRNDKTLAIVDSVQVTSDSAQDATISNALVGAVELSVSGSCIIRNTNQSGKAVSGAAVSGGGDIQVSGGRIEGKIGVDLSGNGNLELSGDGVISGTEYGILALDSSLTADAVVIKGGTVEKTTSSGNGLALAGNFVYEGGVIVAPSNGMLCMSLPSNGEVVQITEPGDRYQWYQLKKKS